MNFSAKLLVCGIAVFTMSACQADSARRAENAAVAEYSLDEPHALISLESGVLARPVALAAGEAGSVYVLDQLDRRVVVASPDGETIRYIGGPGSGPGEFDRPWTLGVGHGKVSVYDSENGSIQAFSTEGNYLGGHRAEVAGAPLSYAFAADGRFAYTSFPARDGLVRVLGSSGEEIAVCGDLVSDEPMQPETLLEQVHERQIPGFMRNRALPSFGSDGSVWVFLQSEGVLQQYSPDGELLTEATVQVPEMELIERDFFDWYADQTALGGIRFLDYLDAMTVVNGRPWLLWKMPPDHPALITVHDSTGKMTARLVVSGVEEETAAPDPTRPPPRRRFAVDPALERLYLVDDQSATLRWVALPQALLANGS